MLCPLLLLLLLLLLLAFVLAHKPMIQSAKRLVKTHRADDHLQPTQPHFVLKHYLWTS
jgi:hypothetical protein